MNNSELLNKSVIQKGLLSTITFSPEEADRFLDYVIDQSVFKNNARIEKMKLAQKNVRAIGLANGVLKPKSTLTDSDIINSLSNDLIALSAKKVRGAILVTDDDLEDAPEGDAFIDHLLGMIARQIANELDSAYYLSEPGAPDEASMLDIYDVWRGWRHRILNDTNLVTGGATILDAQSASDFTLHSGYIAEQNGSAPYQWEIKFAKALKKMPGKYKQLGLQNFRFFVNDQIESDYVDALSGRGTALGDKIILEGGQVAFGKVPIVSAPLMPVDLPMAKSGGGATTVDENSAADQKVLKVAATANFAPGDKILIYKKEVGYKREIAEVASVQDGVSLTLKDNLIYTHLATDAEAVTEVTLDTTDCLLTHKDNLIIGLHRDIKMETQRDAKLEGTIFFYSLRADVAVENLNACVFIKNLKVK
jgi:hypothetical protein